MTFQRCASAGTCLTLTMLWFVCVEDTLHSGTTKFEILRLKYSKWYCTEVEMSRFSKKLQAKCCRGAPTRPLTCDWIFVHRASGWENSLRSLMLGYATLTQTSTKISPRSRFTSYTRMTKSALTRLEFSREKGAHSHLWFLLPLEACLTTANVTTVVSLSYRQWETDLQLEVLVS